MQAQTTQCNNALTVRRTVKLPAMDGPRCEQAIRECLAGLAGMQQVEIDLTHKRLRLAYDAAQLGFGDIEGSLATAGYPLASNKWSRLKGAIYGYLDENIRANAAAKGGACCSNPSDIYAKRHK